MRGKPNFVDVTEVYSLRIRSHFYEAAKEPRLTLHEDVYAAMACPQFETLAEIRLLQAIGSGAVGISTVPEAIQARALSMEVPRCSCLTNLAAGLSLTLFSHENVNAVGREAALQMPKLLIRIYPRFNRCVQG